MHVTQHIWKLKLISPELAKAVDPILSKVIGNVIDDNDKQKANASEPIIVN